MAKFFFLALLVGFSAVIQTFGFSIFGVKPNLALTAIIAVSFFIESVWQGVLMVALSSFILKFSPGFEMEILIFSLIGIGAIAAKGYYPWHYFLSNLISVALATLIFYIFLGINLISSAIFLKELVFNLIAGTLVFAFLSLLWDNKKHEIFLRPY